MSQLVAALILRTPRGRNRPRVAILHDSANKQFYIIGRNGFVVGRGVIIPKVFTFFSETITRFQMNTGFNAVTDVAVIRTHSINRGIAGCVGRPAVHKLMAAVSPLAAVIGISVTGERHKIYLIGFFCGVGGRTKARKDGNAHQDSKKQRYYFFDFFRSHLKTSC